MLVLDFSWLFVSHFMLELFCLMGLFLSIFNCSYAKENVTDFCPSHIEDSSFQLNLVVER